jgi:dihydrofolate reductase
MNERAPTRGEAGMMGKVVHFVSVSTDGVMEAPGHDLSWHRIDEETHEHFNHVLREAGAFLAGRVSYELMADVWPTADENPELSAPEREFAPIWRDKPKLVWSRTLESVAWNTELRREVDADDVQQLKDRHGELIIGSADLVSTFYRLGLVDELRLYVHPVLVGAGTPALPGDLPLDLRLIDSRVFGNGVVLLHYAVSAEGPPG